MLNQKKNQRQSGFTVIEVIVTMAIFSLLFYLASVSYNQMQKSRLVEDQIWQVVSVLRQQQNKAALGEEVSNQQLSFGVVFTTNSYQEFATLTDFSNRETSYDLVNDLASRLEFTNLNFPNTCLQPNDCIIFSPIEGTPSASATVVLENQVGNLRKTISINQQGKVSF